MSTSRGLGRRLERVAPPLAFALVALVAAACGASAAPTIPTLRSPNASPTASISPEQAMRAYVACMRDKGVAMPDPKVQPDGEVELVYPDVVDKRAFVTADEACRSFLANAYPPATPNPNAAQEQDQLLAYARCMREHGIDMKDPQNGEPASVVVEAGAGPNEATATFEAADKACAYLLPGKPGSSPSAGSSASAGPSAGPSASGSGR